MIDEVQVSADCMHLSPDTAVRIVLYYFQVGEHKRQTNTGSSFCELIDLCWWKN